MAVDYSRLAAEYDRGRADDALDRDYWLRGLREVGRIRPGQRVLDLGAGTGRFSRLFSETNDVVAVDPSREMLGLARGKGPFGMVRGDAHRLPFRVDSFDTTILVMVLHHLADLRGALAEISRVSRGVVVATSDLAHRKLGIMEEAFPGLLQIDHGRFPSTEAIVRVLEAARFREVRMERRPYHRVLTSAQQVERVRRRYLSTFDLLPPGEFERGLRFLEVELPRRYGDRFEMHDEFTFLAATR